MIEKLHREDPSLNLTEVCRTLGVSRAGYHAHLHKNQRPRRREDALLITALAKTFIASRETYGSPRLCHALRRQGLRAGKNRIARLMRACQLRVRAKRRFVPRTTVSSPDAPVSPNRLLSAPAPRNVNEVWVTDITYIPTREGWLYLAAELDLHSRRIVGWSTHDTLDTSLPEAALERALTARHRKADLRGLLHHSDRGCQYTSAAFRKHLRLRGITQSMSRKGNCYDNAAMESFWATLKAECFASSIPATRTLATSMIFDYIETFYNPVRLHSALDFRSPMEFELSLQLN
jgi:transposase InsO family protein